MIAQTIYETVRNTLGIGIPELASVFLLLSGLIFFAGGLRTGALGLFMMALLNIIGAYYLNWDMYLPITFFLVSAVILVVASIFGGDEQ